MLSCDPSILPASLKPDLDYCEAHMNVFIVLRHLKAHLINFEPDTIQTLKQTWVRERPEDTWRPQQVIENEETELILCNAKINSKMTVCYVLVDSDYFILVQLVSDSKMCLLEKTNLADADLGFAADPRNLTVN